MTNGGSMIMDGKQAFLTFSKVEDIISNPIACGYLRKFTLSQVSHAKRIREGHGVSSVEISYYPFTLPLVLSLSLSPPPPPPPHLFLLLLLLQRLSYYSLILQ
jgi:hypothetical protein